MDDELKPDSVQQLYGDYPFPSRAWRQLQKLRWLPNSLQRRLMKTDYRRRSVRQIRNHVGPRARILDAGCGTGEFTISMARAFPTSEIVAVDFNPRSIERAREVARALGLDRIEFGQADLSRPLPVSGSFDLITSMGVLHHMKQPEVGLRHVAEHLAPDGRIVLWLYGELGRSVHRAGLELLDILVPDVSDVGTKIELAQPLGLIPPVHGRLLHRFTRRLRGLSPHWEGAEFVADTYAHPRVREYTAASVLELLDSAGLELDTFLSHMRGRPDEIWSDPKLLSRISKLPRDKVLRVMELASRPNGYEVIARRPAMP